MVGSLIILRSDMVWFIFKRTPLVHVFEWTMGVNKHREIMTIQVLLESMNLESTKGGGISLRGMGPGNCLWILDILMQMQEAVVEP